MPKVHVVKAGDHLLALAEANGFADAQPILDDPANQALKDRPNSNVLEPGESVTIPDPKPRVLTLSSGKSHKLKVKKPKVKLKLKLLTFRGKPTAATGATLALDGAADEAVSLSDGAFEHDVSLHCKQAVLTVPALDAQHPELHLKLELGAVGRAEADDGAFARLRNLGYYRAVSAKADDAEKKSAIEEFQLDQGMKLTGTLDDDTKKKIAEIHGS